MLAKKFLGYLNESAPLQVQASLSVVFSGRNFGRGKRPHFTSCEV